MPILVAIGPSFPSLCCFDFFFIFSIYIFFQLNFRQKTFTLMLKLIKLWWFLRFMVRLLLLLFVLFECWLVCVDFFLMKNANGHKIYFLIEVLLEVGKFQMDIYCVKSKNKNKIENVEKLKSIYKIQKITQRILTLQNTVKWITSKFGIYLFWYLLNCYLLKCMKWNGVVWWISWKFNLRQNKCVLCKFISIKFRIKNIQKLQTIGNFPDNENFIN